MTKEYENPNAAETEGMVVVMPSEQAGGIREATKVFA